MNSGTTGGFIKRIRGNNDKDTWRDSMKTIARIGLAVVGMCVLAVAAVASDVTIPNVFTSGTTASAAAVNLNFTAVETAIDDNDARLDALANAALKNGTLQTNLNADQLDGLHEASFFRLDQAEAVTGIPAFNGGTSGSTAPFSVDSNTVVANLNADLLDGYQASSFLLATQKSVIASATIGSASITSTIPAELTSVTITVPSAGVVFVTGGCFVNVSHVTTAPSYYLVGVSTSATTFTYYTMAGVPQASVAGMYLFSCYVSNPFAVSAAGTYTYYLVGKLYTSSDTAAIGVSNRITAVFIAN
jgi:hypothetical protein